MCVFQKKSCKIWADVIVTSHQWKHRWANREKMCCSERSVLAHLQSSDCLSTISAYLSQPVRILIRVINLSFSDDKLLLICTQWFPRPLTASSDHAQHLWAVSSANVSHGLKWSHTSEPENFNVKDGYESRGARQRRQVANVSRDVSSQLSDC